MSVNTKHSFVHIWKRKLHFLPGNKPLYHHKPYYPINVILGIIMCKGLTFEAHVTRIESNKGGLSHVAGEVLSKGFWVCCRKCKHLFVYRQRGEDPAEDQ